MRFLSGWIKNESVALIPDRVIFQVNLLAFIEEVNVLLLSLALFTAQLWCIERHLNDNLSYNCGS